MLGRSSKECALCKNKLEKGIQEEVEVYGKVGKFRKIFCNEEHLKIYIKRTEALMKTRRTCASCKLR
ncbi:MAG: hypothetical protein ABIH52_03205 [Candidatus Aenigmatarchaeota archaeon]|nr:hypothetical protein [Nanoarchaeota archaeon]